MRCPIHNNGQEVEASASLNLDRGVWHCQACKAGGSVAALVKQLDNPRDEPDDDGKAAYDPLMGQPLEAGVVDMATARKGKSSGEAEKINEGLVRRYVADLRERPDLLHYLLEERKLDQSTLDHYDIGYDLRRKKYTIPIRDENGALVNIRRYDQNGTPKMKNAMGHGSPARLYPIEVLDEDELVVGEGEWDALIHGQNAMPTITGTHGVGTWLPEWSKLFKGKTVYVCFDNDKEGRVAAKKVSRSLAAHAAEVWVVAVPARKEHDDLSDLWLRPGAAEEWEAAVGAAVLVQPAGASSAGDVDLSAPELVPVGVIGSMDSRTNGKTLSMQVTITGKKDPTYSVPHKALMTCTLDAGPKCKTCVMHTDYEGEHKVTIDKRDVKAISRFIDANQTQVLEQLRVALGAAKCNRLAHEEIENWSVEELFVTGSIDRRRHTEEADYTHRRIYNIGSHDTKTNQSAIVVGTTVPSHKDRHNEFFSWDLTEAVTSIDKFEMTEGFMDRMKVFRPKGKQRPIAKAREIAKDLSDNVTGIVGRERLHMAYDLVYHSAMGFKLDGKMISRGWLEFIVVGDTRTGKSETALSLSEHYGLGHVVGCEGATFAGLVGGVKQVGDKWTITWGEITLNDRRLVVLDEASGLSQEIISQLSDIRSRGEAQLTKVERHQTKARCRLIWISNPRKSKFVDEKKYDGIDLLEDLIGNPEDIARFDFAMSVSQSDVKSSDINSFERDKVPHVYTGDLCRELIVWAWSRKPDQIDWEDDAYRKVYAGAEWLGKRYVDHPPLIQTTNVREKIARVAVALAARTFSSDETGERIVVKLAHVVDAVKFLDELYSYDNFGYLRLSQRQHRNYRLAAKNRTVMKAWLLTNPRLVEFLLDRRGSFRAQDLEEMANLQRDEVQTSLGKLADAKMITKEKSQILIEPELNDLLKEIERERRRR
jgi:hypothetical protein